MIPVHQFRNVRAAGALGADSVVRRVVVSGCSGGGKSSLLAEMARRGWAICEEPGRRVVRAETVRGGDGLPWMDAERFARLCIETCLADLAQPLQGIVFHDRSLVDSVSALKRMRRMTNFDLKLLDRHRYFETVVLAPPWPGIFAPDTERRHDLASAIAEYEDLCRAFPAAGYAVEELPRASVAGRADWLEALLVGEPEVAR